MDPLILSALAIIATNVLVASLSVPLWLGKVPPNGLYGFRTPRLVNDPRAWYPANRAAGRSPFAGSLLAALVCVVVLALPIPPQAGVSVMVGVEICAMILAIARSFWVASVAVAELDGQLEASAEPPEQSATRARVAPRAREPER